MLKYGWIAWGVFALAVAGGSVRAEESAPEVSDVPVPAGSTCDSCSSCGGRGGCFSRLVAFLTFCPEKGKACCNGGCERCPPPLYAFFPCTGCGADGGVTGCTSCGHSVGRVLRFNKQAGACSTCSNQCGNGRCHRLTTFCPSVIKPDMPCLPPAQFRKGCCGCEGGPTPAFRGGCATCSTFAPPTPVIMPAPTSVVSPPMPIVAPTPAAPQ
jgi:hypothetical protein